MSEQQRAAIVERLGYIEWVRPLIKISRDPDRAAPHFFGIWNRFKESERQYYSGQFEGMSEEELVARMLSNGEE